MNLLLLLSVFGFSSLSQAGENPDITGLWLTKKMDAAVQVEKCGEELCGHVVWLSQNENPYSITGTPLCHAQVLSGFKSADVKGNIWKDGTVYKVDDNKIYGGTLTLVDDNTVKLRAYLGIPALGKTKTLTRTSLNDYPPCTVPTESYTQNLQNISPAAGNQ